MKIALDFLRTSPALVSVMKSATTSMIAVMISLKLAALRTMVNTHTNTVLSLIMATYISICAAASVSVSPMPYITLGTTTGVATLSVPSYDDGVSARIRVPVGFPFGNSTHTRVYVSPSALGKYNTCM